MNKKLLSSHFEKLFMQRLANFFGRDFVEMFYMYSTPPNTEPQAVFGFNLMPVPTI
jgi:hypothetical protein